MNYNQGKNSIGLIPSRLVYRGPLQKEVYNYVEGVPTNKETVSELKKKTIAAIAKRSKTKGEVQQKIKNYNDKYTDANAKPNEPHKRRIPNVNFTQPNVSKKFITKILTDSYIHNGVPRQLQSGHVSSQDRKNQKADLDLLTTSLVKYEADEKAYQLAYTKQMEGHSRGLRLATDKWKKGVDRLRKLKKNDRYNEVSREFDTISRGLVDNPKFKRFYETNGNFNATRKRRMKQLLLGMLAYETNDFKDNILLGSKFKNNATENQKNFPFIFHKWLDHNKFDSKQVNIKKQAVVDIEQDMIAERIPTRTSAMVSGINRSMPAVIRNAVGTFNDPLVTLGPGDSAAHDRRLYALEKFRRKVGRHIEIILDRHPNQKQFAKKVLQGDLIDIQINTHIKRERAWREYRRRQEKMNDLGKKFTRANMRKINLRDQLKWAMSKLHEAVGVVEFPFRARNISNKNNMHSAVYRNLIATVYHQGVARYNPKNRKYIEDMRPEYSWLTTKLVQSNYFNTRNREQFLTRTQKDFLRIGTIGNKMRVNIDISTKAIEEVKKNEQGTINTIKHELSQAHPNRAVIARGIKKLQGYTTRRITTANYNTFEADEQKKIDGWKVILKTIKDLMRPLKDPNDQIEKKKRAQEIRKYIVLIAKNPDIKKSTIEYSEFINKTDIEYETLDRQEKSVDDHLDRLGLNPYNLYDAYLKYKNTVPKMDVSDWDMHLATPAGVQRLTAMFADILPRSPNATNRKNRDNFLAVFSTLNGRVNNRNVAQKDAMEIYLLLKASIDKRGDMGAEGVKKGKQIKKKLEGGSTLDWLENAGYVLKDMTIGPGQSWPTRIAGGALIYILGSLVKRAVKGEKRIDKVLRYGGILAMANIFAGKLLGREFTAMLNMDGLAEKLNGTFDGILLDYNKEDMQKENITGTEHAAALTTMKNVPFSDLMDWYYYVNEHGIDTSGFGSKAKLPKGIDIGLIIPAEMEPENKRHKARRIVQKTMEGMFKYVAHRYPGYGGDPDKAKRALKEKYVTAIRNPNFNLKDTKDAYDFLSPNLLAHYRNHPRMVNWGLIVSSEVRPSDSKKGAIDSTVDFLKKKFSEAEQLTMDNILKPTGVMAEAFWENVKGDYRPKLQGVMKNLYNAGYRKISYHTHKAELWYEGGGKITIRRVIGDHWEVIKMGVKAPFQIMGGIDKYVVGGLLTKGKQLERLFKSGDVSEINGALRVTDIHDRSNPAANKRTLKHLGIYRSNFRVAFGAGGYDRRKGKMVDMLHEDASGIAYGITETILSDAERRKINPGDDTSTKLKKLDINAAEQAFRMFKGRYPHMNEEDIKELMYPIHVFIRRPGRGSGNTGVQSIYTAWRLCGPESKEARRKLEKPSSWTDWRDPRMHKHRPPFMIHDHLGILGNLKRISGYKHPYVQNAKIYSTLVAMQGLRAYLGIAEKGGVLTATAIEKLGFAGVKDTVWFKELVTADEKNLEMLDMLGGGAMYPETAMSQFFKVKHNSDLYKRTWEVTQADPSRPDFHTKLRAITTNRGRATNPNKWKRVRRESWDSRTGGRKTGGLDGPLYMPSI